MLSALLISLCTLTPPTDAEVDRQVAAFLQWQDDAIRDGTSFSGEALVRRADAVFEELPIDELTPAQLATLTFKNSPTMRSSRRDEVKRRLADLAEAPNADGAHAAMTLVMVTSYDEQPEILAAARSALAHPALGDALGAGLGDDFFETVGRSIDVEGSRTLAPDLLALHDDLPHNADAEMLLSLTSLVRMLANIATAEQVPAYHQLRQEVMALVNAAAQASDDGRLATAAGFLDGAYARLELFDHQLPTCDVLWSSDGSTTLSPRDHVVVLEFFATWCTSCIAEFPQYRQFVTRYDGYPVTLIGVSEIEGWHYPAHGERIDTRDRPELEFELMTSFIAERDVQWPIAFVPKGYLYTQFGARGVPSGFVVDSKGFVRARTPYIHRDFDLLCERVDSLLLEAGLPAPPPLR